MDTMQPLERQPLDGLRILDLTHFLSGPYATMILGDLGAEIIKVEPPKGDPTRGIPPLQTDMDSGTFYFAVNRNKKSVVFDLKSNEGREAFLKLLDEADVLVENFRPDVLDRLGLGYESLKQRRPSLVMVSIYGFERKGEFAGFPAVDTLVQALSGIMSLTGERDGPPARVGVQIGDTVAGLWAAIAILAGLYGRGQTGKGRHLEISMLDAQLSLLVWQAQDYLTHGTVYRRMGTRHATLPPSQAFACADGRYVYATPSAIPHWWKAYCEALELPELAEDPRFHDLAARQVNRDVLEEVLGAQFATREARHWLERFREYDVPAALVQTLDEALAFPTVARRNMIVEVEGRAGKARMLGNPIKSGAMERFSAPPVLGEHTDEVVANGWTGRELVR